jgi:phosphatidylglycerol:prolipoprotein diacylglycerol transferase
VHPILAQWHWHGQEWTIASYGVCLLLAIVVGAVWCMHAGHRVASRLWWLDVVVSTVVIGLLGAKLLFVLVLMATGSSGEEAWHQFRYGGGVWLGGPLLAVPFAVWRVRRSGLSLQRVAAVMLVALPLAHAFGRLGCFLAGCCFGSATTLPWAVTFFAAEAAAVGAPIGVPLHPVQLYEAALELVNFGILKRRFERDAHAAQLARTWLTLYALERFALEFIRGDARGQWLWFSTSQWLSLAMLMVVALWWWQHDRPVDTVLQP